MNHLPEMPGHHRPEAQAPSSNEGRGERIGMNPEKQREAIGAVCGWKFHKGTPVTYGGSSWPPRWVREENRPAGKHLSRSSLPNYLSDLNAMAEAEETLTEDQQLDYRRALCAVVGGSRTNLKTFAQITATAKQRAEAFLRVHGKWQD